MNTRATGNQCRQAAAWCNANGAKIEKQEDGTYKIVAVIIPTPTNDELCVCAREKRDGYLSICDAITNRHRDQVDASLDTTLTNAQYLEVLVLKQALRDIPQQSGFPDSITWPTVPTFLQSQFEALNV